MPTLLRGRLRWIALVLALVFPGFLLHALEKTSSPKVLKIGFLMDSLKVERWQTDLDKFQKRAAELGAVVLVETAEGDDELQLEQARKLPSTRTDAVAAEGPEPAHRK